jgi:hypothetical protein
MAKLALFAYNGEAMCFMHVLLNALDFKAEGHDVKVVIEGAACKLIPELAQADSPMHQLYAKAREMGLIDGVCKACALKLGTLGEAQEQGLTVLEDMKGHAGMARYERTGYTIITF